jgi:transcriptional regulator with XRE-family HTH domain
MIGQTVVTKAAETREVAVPEDAALTPLSRLVIEELERQGISRRQMAARGGLSPERIAYYMGPRWPRDKMPATSVLQGIADGLRIPLARVQAAALETTGGGRLGGLTADQQTVVDAMSSLSPRYQRALADVVLRLAQEYGAVDHDA